MKRSSSTADIKARILFGLDSYVDASSISSSTDGLPTLICNKLKSYMIFVYFVSNLLCYVTLYMLFVMIHVLYRDE